ncbi:MAG: hypothetical protein ACI4UM_09695 [Succinivibrio sp.]
MQFILLAKKLKPFTLLIAILLGFLTFVLFHYVQATICLRPAAKLIDSNLHLVLCLILFCAYMKIDFRQMKPRTWHLIVCLIQIIFGLSFALLVNIAGFSDFVDTILMGVIVCILTPTAASASVITGKLGGNESTLTTFIIIGNFVASIGIPLIFPIISNDETSSFWQEFLSILCLVFPIIILPLSVAVFIRSFMKRLTKFLIGHIKDLGFYLWAFVIYVMSAKTFANIANSNCSFEQIVLFSFAGLVCTVTQFALGKAIGQIYGLRISAGQGMGQKNMLLGIWVTLTYLYPTVSIIPGTYILWQNIINAWQMWHRERMIRIWERLGIPPYQE